MNRIVDVTWLTQLTSLVVFYYIVLMLISVINERRRQWRRRARGTAPYRPAVVLVIPARNESAVIRATLDSLDNLDYAERLIMVMNDGSADDTSAICHAFRGRGEVFVVDRGPEIAGRGKGDVLNHAFHIVQRLLASTHPLLGGRDARDVLIGIMDADGQLDVNALSSVVRYFESGDVGAVQIGVRIANANDNMLARMQDIEFVGFSGLVQNARNAFGSVGLGGNGQFARLSALLDLDRNPWTECLSEDLDLSLSLVRRGHSVRFCGQTFVAQQGLTRLGPLFRQRARWVQGHYQCWRHLPGLLTNPKVSWRTKIDLSLYLLMITFVLVIATGLALTALSLTGMITLTNEAFVWLPSGILQNTVMLTVSVGPALGFILTYQRRARFPLAWWEIPAYTVAFCLYGNHWIVSQFWALGRMALRRNGWSKTPRVLTNATPEFAR